MLRFVKLDGLIKVTQLHINLNNSLKWSRVASFVSKEQKDQWETEFEEYIESREQQISDDEDVALPGTGTGSGTGTPTTQTPNGANSLKKSSSDVRSIAASER